MTVSPQSTVIESYYPFSTIYIHSCDSSCFSSVLPILLILYLRYQHGRPPPVVTIVPTKDILLTITQTMQPVTMEHIVAQKPDWTSNVMTPKQHQEKYLEPR